MSVLSSCRCTHPTDPPCSRPITEEDLRCDVCRAGCRSLVGAGGPKRGHVEVIEAGDYGTAAACEIVSDTGDRMEIRWHRKAAS